MFTNEELGMIVQVLQQVSFKAGQSQQMILTERILKKIEDKFQIEQKKDKELLRN
jgi:hypothetical protein